jgi:hypothetical protein
MRAARAKKRRKKAWIKVQLTGPTPTRPASGTSSSQTRIATLTTVSTSTI